MKPLTTQSAGRSRPKTDTHDPGNPGPGGKRTMRPCPRGLEDACSVPRDLCLEEHSRTGSWDCEKLLDELEWFLSGGEEESGGFFDAIRDGD
ncbi:MAG: hypothetical protein V1800_04755 [Candidatus Latescibacterota bacterium]